MKVGVDAFTIRSFGLDAYQTLAFAQEHGLAGVQFGPVSSIIPSLDAGEARAFRAQADALGLYAHVSVPHLNPVHFGADRAGYTANFRRQLELCREMGCTDVHAALGNERDRLASPIPWNEHLAASRTYIQSELAPILRDLGIRLAIEDHGDTTTFDLVRLIEDLGDDILGICLDTANVLVNVEDPLAAVRRAAPYVRLTHAKDAIVYLSEYGLERQVRPCGKGVVPWPEALRLLAEHHPTLTLSIEDHQENPGANDGKVSYSMPVFDSDWLAHFPDVSADELAQLFATAYRVGQEIARGEREHPDVYGVTWETHGAPRLHASRDYLNGVLAQLGLTA